MPPTAKKKVSRWDMSRWTPGKVTLFQALGLNWNVQYPKLNASLQQQAIQVQNAQGGGSTPTGSVSTKGASGARGIYNALTSAGASPAQAIGLIANAINESSLDPEARAMDTNGYYSNGLWMFNEQGFPSSGALVTGHPAADLIAQVKFLFQTGGLRAASGSTPEQVAGNFAANYERCQGCQSGETQYNARVANVAKVKAMLGM